MRSLVLKQISLTLLLSTCAAIAHADEDIVVVTVNGEPILEQQIVDEADNRINVNKVRDAAKGLIYDESSRDATRDHMRLEVVNSLIERLLISQQLRADGIQITDSEVDANFAKMAKERGHSLEQAERLIQSQGRTVHAVKERIRWNTIGVEKLYETHAADKKVLTESEALKLYTDYPAEFDTQETRRVSHILIRVRPDADESTKQVSRRKALTLLERVRAGEDFPALAKSFSDDHASRTNGGDRGFSARGIILGPNDDPFGNAAFALRSVGDVSDVVATAEGFHIIKLTGLDPARRKSFDEVKEQLIADFRYREIGNFWERFGGEIRAKANIEWTPEGNARQEQAAERQRRFNEKVEKLIADEQEKARQTQERTTHSPAK